MLRKAPHFSGTVTFMKLVDRTCVGNGSTFLSSGTRLVKSFTVGGK